MSRLIEPLESRRLFSGLTADFTSLGSAPLNKPGLGALFGVTASDGGPNLGLLKGSLLNTSVPADAFGTTSGFPYTLANVAPILRKVGIKTTVRYADMIGGFPYVWKSLADWDAKVSGETTAIKNNFKDVVHAIAVFNEPDNTMQGAFLTDPALPAGSYDSKVNWLWTHTVQMIRGIDLTLKVMGPNYVAYYPTLDASQQTRMRTFLQNAIATNTVPDIMGWHQLYGPAVNTFTATMAAYRGLETSLGLPKLPVQIEEFGYNNGKFEGIPSAQMPWWAEYERQGVSWASAGVYDNGGTLDNTISSFREASPQPNAGWWFHNWYMTMSGVSVPTTAASTRYSGAYEGIASYNAASKTGTLILGGPDDNASIYLKGVGRLIGGSVRVQVQDVRWTADDAAREPNTTLEHGGDALYAPTTLYEKIVTPDASGDIRLNVRIEDLHGYRVLITPATADTTPRLEAEHAVVTNGSVVTGTAAANAQSNGGYVTNLTAADSAAMFTAIVPYDGQYALTLAYGAAAAAGDYLSINGVATAAVSLPATGGGLGGTPAKTLTRMVMLKAGVNTITLTRAFGAADLDYVSVAPMAPSKYEAESAVRTGGVTYTGGPLASGGGYVGGLAAGDELAFNVVVPTAGFYAMHIRYAAGGGAATQAVSVNGQSQGDVGYVGTNTNAAVEFRMATKLVAMRAGLNVIRLTKGAGDAEIDFVDVQPNTHRYEAETATFANANGRIFSPAYIDTFWNYVGQIDIVNDSYVSWQVEAPMAGAYTIQVGYANGGTANATDSVTLNGSSAGAIGLPRTAGWFGSVGPINAGGIATMTLSLAAGWNTIKLARLTGYAELNYLKLVYAPAAAVASGSSTGVAPKKGTSSAPLAAGQPFEPAMLLSSPATPLEPDIASPFIVQDR